VPRPNTSCRSATPAIFRTSRLIWQRLFRKIDGATRASAREKRGKSNAAGDFFGAVKHASKKACFDGMNCDWWTVPTLRIQSVSGQYVMPMRPASRSMKSPMRAAIADKPGNLHPSSDPISGRNTFQRIDVRPRLAKLGYCAIIPQPRAPNSSPESPAPSPQPRVPSPESPAPSPQPQTDPRGTSDY